MIILTFPHMQILYDIGQAIADVTTPHSFATKKKGRKSSTIKPSE